MGVTISDVASRAGVSKTTVSRVLNGKGELAQSTVRRVQEAISELGFVPSAGGVGLARGRTRMVGLFVPSLSENWVARLAEGAVDALESKGFGLRLFTFRRGAESLRGLGVHAAAKSIDGLIVIDPLGTEPFFSELYRAGLPVVMVDDRGHLPELPHVTCTNSAGGAAAADHLLAIGRIHPLVVRGPLEYGCTHDRLAGFSDAYSAAGHPIDQRFIVDGALSYEGGQSAVARALAEGLHFDSLFAHNDLSAAGAIRALRDAGLQVPEDVAVVGFDDVEMASRTDLALTTVHQPFAEMGAAAAELLLDHLQDPHNAAPSRTLATSFVVRGSA
ncbi:MULTISPECIES: LacI family DNA-binding transcriptional regulator [unclassified Leifsonia]|uniref:LacI family DNA-binding transcriptional regulator n=1 Tax=unclassified Leifsonia TaxID=2663824 RepID=UPI0008A7EFDD|nr:MULTISPECIES: LacI family DNA-binding transcriptional regulator [unclassified Leifsonia]SEH56703.1 transcriptional regulator, LacI family [Leifsonia sp. CL154]SFL22171.1 transcriptional regulator, LacI family [Leifsonia sp. CL147]